MAKNKNNDFIDIASLLKQYISKWYLFVISVVICGALAFAYTKIRHQEYTVRANMLITPEKGEQTGGDAVSGFLSSMFGAEGYVEDEIFLVSSHSLYMEVARTLGLTQQYFVKKGLIGYDMAFPTSPLKVTPQAGMLDTLSVNIVFKVSVNDDGVAKVSGKIKRTTVVKEKNLRFPFTLDTPLGKFTFEQTDTYPIGEDLTARVLVQGYDAAAEELDETVVNSIASKRSNVISLSINTANVPYGKAVLNQIIEEYNLRGVTKKNEDNARTAQFIDGRLALLAAELSEAEKTIQKYKEDRNIIDIEFQAEYHAQKQSRIEEELLNAQTREEVTLLTLRFLEDPRNSYSLIPTTLDNEGLQRNIDNYNTVIMERMDLANSARGDNAALKTMSERIDVMRNNIIASVKRALEASTVSTNDLRAELEATSGQLANIPQQEREFRDMVRQRDVKQTLYVFLLERREQTAMMLAKTFPKGQIIDQAYCLSKPLGLSTKAILLLAIIFGLLIPPIYLFIRRMFGTTISNRAEVERLTDAPIIGEIAIDRSGDSLVVTSDSTSAASEMFRIVRSNLLFVINDPRDKVVLVTSSQPHEGKSYIAINLAASLALMGKRVLLVGADIRNPRLATYLHLTSNVGLTNYLSSTSVGIPDIIQPIKKVDGLSVILSGPVPPNPSELLSSRKIDDLFATLRKDYDYIIVDTAPIGPVSDTFSLDRIADASIYVCRVGYTEPASIDMVDEIYEQHRLKKLSVIINGVKTSKTYGYGTGGQ